MDQKCIIVTAIRFWNIFEKYWKLAKIWAKNGRFLRFSRQILKKKTLTKSKLLYWKNSSIKLKIGQNVARVPLYKFTTAFFEILIIFQFIGFRIEQSGYFCQKLTKNWPKYPFCSILNPINWKISKISNKSSCKFIEGYSSNILAKFQLNWTSFQ